MSIKDIMRKHGYTGGKKGWFEVKEPSLEDVRRIVAKGKLEEAGFRIPVELHSLLDISPEGGAGGDTGYPRGATEFSG